MEKTAVSLRYEFGAGVFQRFQLCRNAFRKNVEKVNFYYERTSVRFVEILFYLETSVCSFYLSISTGLNFIDALCISACNPVAWFHS
jgi:hypothetical protein